MEKILRYIICVYIVVAHTNYVIAQHTIVKGIITDSITREPIPLVNVSFDKANVGTVTDFEGKFIINVDKDYTKLKATHLGYKTEIKNIKQRTEQIINFRLVPQATQLKEIAVHTKKSKYRNKNNPAVDLIKKVIDHKSVNRKEGFNYYEYEKYEKVQFALSNITDKFMHRKAFKKFQFIFENIDTSKLDGKPVLPVYLKESLSDVYFRKSPSIRKEKVIANKAVAFEGYIDNQGLDMYMKYLYQDINIYDNNITLLTNQFISPISAMSPVFYRFFITDTVKENSIKYIKLNFIPRNHSDFLFQGYMYITLDSSYAVKKVDMSVNKDINLNWVKELKIEQDFEKIEDQGYSLVSDEFSADFGLSKDKMGIFGQRTVSYKKIKFNTPRLDKDYKGEVVEMNEKDIAKPDSFWTANRHMALSKSEKGVYISIDSIKKVPAFKHTMDIMVLLFAGYKNIGPYFEIGPISTFYSFNPVEGFRLRAGGRTTIAFSKKINFESYAAYGFKDEKWKYYLGTTYSLSKKSIYEFPVKSLKFSYQKETKIPGQELQFIQEDNFLLSFKRGINDKWLYNDIIKFEYLNEFKNHFSFFVGFKNWKQQAAGGLHFNTNDYYDYKTETKQLQTSELSLTLRWAPNEQFYQGKSYRIPITFQNPIFTLRLINGVNGLFGGEYNYQNLSLNIIKRFYFSQLGYTDVILEGGKIFGTLPFPLLFVHRANQTYAYQLGSYNLMNFLEFVSDKYASVNVDHYFNGFFFNKIPLLKRLRWREVVSVKVLYGGVSNNNNPAITPGLFQTPKTPEGLPSTYSLKDRPYIEGSVAIANVFKFFRIDLVKRFTYLDHPNISTLGIRVRFRFDF